MLGYHGPVTPGRKTVARFGCSEEVLIEPPFCMERSRDEIARGTFHLCKQVHFLESCGWALSFAHGPDDRSIFLPNVGDDLKLNVADGFAEVPCCLNHLDLDTYFGLFLQKQVSAGASWERCLTEDSKSFPGPLSGESVFLDRVAVSSFPLSAGQSLFFRFYVPSGPFHITDKVISLYFCGPCSSGSDIEGYGQYALIFLGNGEAHLYERGQVPLKKESRWVLRSGFRYCESSQVGSRLHTLLIRPFFEGSVHSGIRGIIFVTSGGDAGPGKEVVALKYYSKVRSGNTYVYTPVTCGHRVCFQEMPLRVDIRRDLRVLFQVSKASYFSEGVLQDDPFSLPFYPSSGHHMRLEWFGQVPKGCKLTGKLFCANDSKEDELEIVEEGDFHKEYRITFPKNAYYAKFFLKGNGKDTPLLFRYRVVRDGLIREVESDAFETDLLQEVQFTGNKENPSDESGELIIKGVDKKLEKLLDKNCLSVEVVTSFEDTESILFRGYVVSSQYLSCPLNGLAPSEGNVAYVKCHLASMWHRLNEVSVPYRYRWDVDPESPIIEGTHAPFKVIEVLCTLLNWSGFSEKMIDLPDLPIRMWEGDGFVIEPFAHIGDVVLKIAREYLGSSLFFDANAGSSGMWKLMPLIDSGVEGGLGIERSTGEVEKIRVQFLSSVGYFKKYSEEGVEHQDETVPPFTFIQKGSLKTCARSPAANHLSVSGVSFSTSFGCPYRLTQVLVNAQSYSFSSKETSDPSHPDYLGRIVSKSILDPTLSTEAAVNWAAKRYFEKFCRGKWVCRFEAPLVFVDASENKSNQKARSLRYGDWVEINGIRWQVRSVHARYKKDAHQMAFYECERR